MLWQPGGQRAEQVRFVVSLLRVKEHPESFDGFIKHREHFKDGSTLHSKLKLPGVNFKQ